MKTEVNSSDFKNIPIVISLTGYLQYKGEHFRKNNLFQHFKRFKKNTL